MKRCWRTRVTYSGAAELRHELNDPGERDMTARDDGVNRLLAALRAVPGADVDDLQARLDALEAHGTKPVVTLFGSYDTGKTSLLKRLLVDDALPVPRWATISARHETFQAAEAEGQDWVIRDTPGLQAGIASHQDRALDALALSDAWLIVLPPQLLTGEAETIRALITGRLFDASGCAAPSEAIHLVVNRMDEAGVDPAESVDEYQRLLTRKEHELVEMLEREAIRIDAGVVHFVAADAYQRVGNRVEVRREDYDVTREWDGIDRLASSLRRLRPALPALRAAARRRFALQAGNRAREALRAEQEKLTESRAEALRWVERHRLAREQFDALVESARVELPGSVEEELLAVGRLGHDDARAILDALEPRLLQAMDRWSARHDAQLARLAEEIDVEFDASRTRPAVLQLESYFQSPAKPSGARSTASPSETVERIRSVAQSAVAIAHGIHLREDLEEGRRRWKESGQKGWSASSKAQEKAALSGRYVVIHDTLEQAGPIAIELARFVISEIQDARAARERAHHREKLRTQLADAAHRMALTLFTGDATQSIVGWQEHANELRTAIDQLFRPYREMAQAVDGSLANIDQCFNEIDAGLQRLR